MLLAPWLRWDAVWFRRILVQGYLPWDGSTSFHPLYPGLSWLLYRLGLDPLLSLLITASLASLAFFLVFHRLASLDLEPGEARGALLLLATFPAAVVLFAPYTESLFLLCSALAFLALRRRHRSLAALAAFLAALTRQQGLFLVLPLAWDAWQVSGRSLGGIGRNWKAWLGTLAPPAGLLCWSVYRISILGEGGLDLSSPQGLIYSAFLSPSAEKVVAGQAFRWPWQALWLAISRVLHAPEINVILNLGLGLGFVIAFALAWKYIGIPERLYSLAVVLVSFCVTTGEFAYISLPRHLLLAFPVFIGLAAALKKTWQKPLLIALQFPLMLFLLLLYVFIQWIP